MLISAKLEEAINRQIGREMGASMQYLAIAAHFDRQSLKQMARFFYRQADEERTHALKFLHFVIAAGGTVQVPAIAAPKGDLHSARECAQLSLDWEREVTQQIYELVDCAHGDKNYIALRFLDWFVTEQLEEVSLMDNLVSIIARAGEQNLLLVEDYLARESLVPAPTSGA
ncbi:MAG TPA: ferritin [Thermoanaerobaculia bacterium]|jgi:ferritin|nr:ferritin [Thermoanaerobaculia bacterium]